MNHSFYADISRIYLDSTQLVRDGSSNWSVPPVGFDDSDGCKGRSQCTGKAQLSHLVNDLNNPAGCWIDQNHMLINATNPPTT